MTSIPVLVDLCMPLSAGLDLSNLLREVRPQHELLPGVLGSEGWLTAEAGGPARLHLDFPLAAKVTRSAKRQGVDGIDISSAILFRFEPCRVDIFSVAV